MGVSDNVPIHYNGSSVYAQVITQDGGSILAPAIVKLLAHDESVDNPR